MQRLGYISSGCARAVWAASVLILLVTAQREAGAERIRGTWEFFPTGGLPYAGKTDIAIDEDGTPWFLGRGTLGRFNGESFIDIQVGDSEQRGKFICLEGGPESGAYAVRYNRPTGFLSFYRLDADGVHLITEYEDKPGGRFFQTFVSRRERIFVWGEDFVAQYSGGRWLRIDADLVPRATKIFDLGEKVYFYCVHRCYVSSGEGGMEPLELPRWEVISPGSWADVTGTVQANGDIFLVHRGRGEVEGFCFNAESLEPGWGDQYVIPIDPELKVAEVYSTPGGKIWLLCYTDSLGHAAFYEVGENGKVSRIADAPWQLLNPLRSDVSIPAYLQASDGSMWFGLPERGLAVYHEGAFTCFDWGYGFSTSVRSIRETPNGDIWVPADTRRMARFRRGEEPVEPSGPCVEWDPFPIAGRVWSTDDGEILLIPRDRRDVLLRWNGEDWTETQMPFQVQRIDKILVSDLGDVISGGRKEAHVVSADGVSTFESNLDAYVAIAEGGARVLRADYGRTPVLILPKNRIWSLLWGDWWGVSYYDGERWDTVPLDANPESVMPSDRYGVLIRDNQGRFFTYDRGVLVPLDKGLREMDELMLGPFGFQPYERSMVEKSGRQYLPVLGKYPRRYLFQAPDVFEALSGTPAALEEIEKRATRIPDHIDQLKPGRILGWWLLGRQSRVFRLVGAHLIPFEPTCQLAGVGRPPFDVHEDRAGNVWAVADPRDDHAMAGVHHLGTIPLPLPAVTGRIGRKLVIPLPDVGRPGKSDLLVFTRIGGGTWVEQEARNGLVFRFPETGEYECEFAAILPSGETLPGSRSFTVEAEVALPDTVLNSEGPFRVEMPGWLPPVSLIPSSPGEEPRVEYRVNGGLWQSASPEGAISFLRSATGNLKVEIAAVEDGFWRDPTPLMVEVEYDIDIERLVDAVLEELYMAEEPDIRTLAGILAAAGPEVLPFLQREVEEAAGLQNNIMILQSLIRRLQSQ